MHGKNWLDWRFLLSCALLAILGVSVYIGVPTGRVIRDPAAFAEPYRTDVWTATRHLSSAQNAELHFRKHARYLGIKTRDEYVRRATAFLHHPPVDATIRTQDDGDTEIYRAATKEFGVMNKYGVPRTYFKRDRPPAGN